MNLRNAFLILSAFCGSILLALSLYVSLLSNLPSSIRKRPHKIKNDDQVLFEDDDDLQFNNPIPPSQNEPVPTRHSINRCSTRSPSFGSIFSFPQPKIMKSLSEIDSSEWICSVRQFLNTFTSDKPLALITSNSKYIDVLLNWLISATVRSQIPPDTILILSLDENLHRMLVKRGIASVYVTPAMLFLPQVTVRAMFEEIMMLRLAVMRIVNHFGFDVVMYDTDAIILKDPQPLYDKLASEDIIGSVGKIPKDLVEEWGITICIGVVLVKHSQRTETYWNSMKDICTDVVDDQGKLNCGLKALDIHWENNASSYQNTTIRGKARNGLRVSILPYDYICRQTTCDASLRNTYYIWHKGGQRTRNDKLASARDGRTWFLKFKWEKIRNNLVGLDWLNSICYPGVTHE